MHASDIVFPATESTFYAVVEAHSAQLLAVAMKITKNRPAAEDIVQEAFLKLWQKRAEVVPGNLGGWLYKVVSNLSYKHLQKESRQLQVIYSLQRTGASHCDGVDDLLISKENNELFNGIIRRLPEKQQMVYHLSREKGLRRDEIADRLKLSPNTVKVHLTRALQFIREHLAGASIFFLCFIIQHFIFRDSNTNAAQKDLYSITKHPISRDFPEKKVIRMPSAGLVSLTGIYR